MKIDRLFCDYYEKMSDLSLKSKMEMLKRNTTAKNALAKRRKDVIKSERKGAQSQLRPYESTEESSEELPEPNVVIMLKPFNPEDYEQKSEEPSEVISVYKTIELLQMLLPEKSNLDSEEVDTDQDLTFDLLKFGINLIGKEGPISLNVSDMTSNLDDESLNDLVIGTEGQYISVVDVIGCLEKLAELMPDRRRLHFAGIHETGGLPAVRSFFGGSKLTGYRISFD